MLFNPGPTNVSEEVREAIKTKDICHREKEFFELLSRVRSKILKVINGEKTHTAVFFVSSATGCNEAVIASIEGKVLLINNGKYAQRLKEIIERYHLPLIELKFDPLKEINLEVIEKALKENSDISHIAMVHHETTTGFLAPLREIGQLAKIYDKFLFADTASSFGGHLIDVKVDNLSFCTASVNKCLESFPGISFVIAEITALEKTKGKSRSFYFDLYRQWEKEEKEKQLPFTPAVQLFFALDRALDELMEEGIKERIKRYEENARRMREGLKNLGFKFLLPEHLLKSNVVTSILLPSNMDYWKVHDLLKERGQVIYTGKETLEKGIFRIATMGHLKAEDIDLFLKDLEDILKKTGSYPVKYEA